MLGQPVSTEVSAHESKYYKFITQSNEPVEIDINTLSGLVTFTISSSQPKADGNIPVSDIIYSGFTSESYYLFDEDNTAFKIGSTYFLTLESEIDSRIVISVSHLTDYKMISDATPQTVTLREEGNIFYYLIDPIEDQAQIIVEAIPKVRDTQFEIYVKKQVITIQEETKNHEHHSKLPVWMIAQEEIVEKADYKQRYGVGNQIFQDIILTLNNSPNTKEVLLIDIQSSMAGRKVELVITSSNTQPIKINQRYHGSVKNIPGKFKIYETYVLQNNNPNETFVIEVENCEGSSEIFIANSFSDLIENKLQLRNSQSQYGKIYAGLPAPELGLTKYIIAVKSNNDIAGFKDLDISEFKIESRSFDNGGIQNPSYIEKYFIPNNGRLDFEWYEDMKEGEYFLKVEPPKVYDYTGKLEFSMDDEMMELEVYVSDHDLGANSPCSIAKHYDLIEGQDIVRFSEFDFILINVESIFDDLEEDATYFYVFIVANIPGDRDSIAFQPLKVAVPEDFYLPLPSKSTFNLQ